MLQKASQRISHPFLVKSSNYLHPTPYHFRSVPLQFIHPQFTQISSIPFIISQFFPQIISRKSHLKSMHFSKLISSNTHTPPHSLPTQNHFRLLEKGSGPIPYGPTHSTTLVLDPALLLISSNCVLFVVPATAFYQHLLDPIYSNVTNCVCVILFKPASSESFGPGAAMVVETVCGWRIPTFIYQHQEMAMEVDCVRVSSV